ncbi:MAG: hypothetical protein JXB50_05955 [Spirochaetes bacterium]|nr:hypothetical protein [Spirochaetota bacterium]
MANDFDNLEKRAKEIFEDLYKKFDLRVKELSNQIKDNILPDTQERLRQNIFKTVLISFGIGFIIGAFIALFGFKSPSKKRK